VPRTGFRGCLAASQVLRSGFRGLPRKPKVVRRRFSGLCEKKKGLAAAHKCLVWSQLAQGSLPASRREVLRASLAAGFIRWLASDPLGLSRNPRGGTRAGGGTGAKPLYKAEPEGRSAQKMYGNLRGAIPELARLHRGSCAAPSRNLSGTIAKIAGSDRGETPKPAYFFWTRKHARNLSGTIAKIAGSDRGETPKPAYFFWTRKHAWLGWLA
jgi:hypothetical protein